MFYFTVYTGIKHNDRKCVDTNNYKSRLTPKTNYVIGTLYFCGSKVQLESASRNFTPHVG